MNKRKLFNLGPWMTFSASIALSASMGVAANPNFSQDEFTSNDAPSISTSKAYILSHTNVARLEELKTKFAHDYQVLQFKVEQLKMYPTPQHLSLLSEKGISQNSEGAFENQFGKIVTPSYLDANGQVRFAQDDNVDAATTSRVDKIWNGGISGLNLDGAGIEIAVWESGYANATHQEFGGRASNAGDGGGTSAHGSHTGGTLIASGVDAQARGMANAATIKNYTASNMPAEAAAFAAAGGILANNSNSPQGTAGEYETNAQGMDDVLFNAPFYTHVKSAGNNGGQSYGALYANQLAKNLLIIANNEDALDYTGPSSVTMAGSSSMGPSNDWRIKPDITNNGSGLYSTDTGDTTYSTKTGTSMSTPATTGAIALLQQHYKNLNAVYMRSATVKALLINTADEVGAADGPDFRAGFGLVNAQSAAEVISNKSDSASSNTVILEALTLNNGATYTQGISSDGVTPTSLTIAWTDPKGALVSGNTRALVNDLDVRIVDANNTYYPWVMVPNASYNNYTDPAQQADNDRDNVERIDALLPSGSYTIQVTHKGTLTNNSQDFSMVATGVVTGPIPNSAPVSSFTYSANKLVVDFTDASSDQDGTVISHSWNFGDNSTSTLTSPQHTYAADGTYTISLTVTDDDGATHVSSQTMTVSSANQAPTSSFTYNKSKLVVNFSDSSSDADGSVVGRSWDFGDNTTSTQASPTHTYTADGTYTVSLTVTDNEGVTNSSNQSVTVINLGPNELESGVAKILSGAKDSDAFYTMAVPAGATDLSFVMSGGTGDADLYVRFGSQPTTSTYDCRPYAGGNNETCDINPVQAGTYHMMISAYATFSGVSLIGSYTTAQANQTPTASFTNNCTDLNCNFNGSASSDSDGTIATYAWNFGEGSNGSGATPSHSYSAAGSYTVQLTVTDNQGATDSSTATVTVTESPVQDNVLQNGVAKAVAEVATGAEVNYTMEVPSGATDITIVMAGGTGDADMYVKFGSAPTDSSYDCRPYANGNAETCNGTSTGGTYYVRLKAYSTFANVSLTGSYTDGGTPTDPSVIINGVAKTGLAGSSSDSYTMVVPAGATNLVFSTSGGTGDADLYVRFGSAPTTSQYDCRPYAGGNSETCTISNIQAGTYHVMINAYSAYTGVTLTGSHD